MAMVHEREGREDWPPYIIYDDDLVTCSNMKEADGNKVLPFFGYNRAVQQGDPLQRLVQPSRRRMAASAVNLSGPFWSCNYSG